MKYNADVNGRTTELELSGSEDELRIGPADSATQASLEAIGNGRYILRIGAKVIDGYVIATEDGFEVTDFGKPFVRTICAAFDAYLGQSKAQHALAV